MKLAGAYINDDTYARLVALAAANNRTLAGQCRHLFDRALKGALTVPDAPHEAAAGRKPVLRAVARALKALKANPQPESAAEARVAKPLTVALPGTGHETETFPRAGRGVAVVGPVATGLSATPMPPAPGHTHAGRAPCCGGHRDGTPFDTTPMTTPSANHPCLCHKIPHPLPHRAPEGASEPHTASRRTPR